MSNIESLGKVLSTDLLVVGGGLAGLTAAIAAKETKPEIDVLIVDKASASKGMVGKAARSAGILSFVTPEDDPEEFVKFFVHNVGYFLCDQLLLREFAYYSRSIVEHLSLWNVEVWRGPDGKIQYTKGPFPWGTTTVDPDMCRNMAKYAKNLGVKFVDKVCIAGLLKDEDNVSGAVGFSLSDGTFYIMKAKAVILATGSQNYGVTLLWIGTGNGILFAYKAGAEMRNVEFGNMFDFTRISPEGWIFSGVHGGAHVAHDFLVNSKGENLSRKYQIKPPDSPETVLAWYRETLAGNGPIFVDFKAAQGPQMLRMHKKVQERFGCINSKVPPLKEDKAEVVPYFIGELSCVRVNHQMATSVPGLFAVGDVCGNGSARGGAAPTPPHKIHGTGLLNALFTGMRGGAAAAVYVSALKAINFEPEVDYDQVKELKDEVFAPLRRRTGFSPREIIHKIQDIIVPVDCSIIKSEERMEECLNYVLSVKEKIREIKAEDFHDLAKCIDAESMALCAEMFYRASLMRTESRGFHIREDYPEMDNKNWLKWIIVKKENETMKLYTEDVPIHKYPYKPFQ